MKYSQEKKAAAIERIAKIGVKRASEELGISVQTLYKWRNEGDSGTMRSRPVLSEAKTEELRQALLNDQFLESKVKQLEDQNHALRDENKMLRAKAAQMKKAISDLIG